MPPAGKARQKLSQEKRRRRGAAEFEGGIGNGNQRSAHRSAVLASMPKDCRARFDLYLKSEKIFAPFARQSKPCHSNRVFSRLIKINAYGGVSGVSIEFCAHARRPELGLGNQKGASHANLHHAYALDPGCGPLAQSLGRPGAKGGRSYPRDLPRCGMGRQLRGAWAL